MTSTPAIAVSDWEAIMAFLVRTHSVAMVHGERGWSGPITFENRMTGDNRIFEPGSVCWDSSSFPLPFRWVRTDLGGHLSAVVIGRVDEIFRTEAAPGVIFGRGIIFSGPEAPPEALQYLDLVESHAAGGVSIDADEPKYKIIAGIVDPTPEDEPTAVTEVMAFSSIRIRGLTGVDIPAFIDAKIQLDGKPVPL